MNDSPKAGVIGDPIGHSLSPVIHQYWLNKYQLDGSYHAVHVTTEALAAFIRQTKEQDWRGFNVTLPHKETIIPLLDEIDDIARDIGAVNTVYKQKGKLIGTNSDAEGFAAPLRRLGISTDKPALILGAGGAARAVIAALKMLEINDITIINRNHQKAELLAGYFKIKTAPASRIAEEALSSSFIINTTSLGMAGQPPLNFPFNALPDNLADKLFYDIVYKPLKTDWLKQAEDKGATIIGGLLMLAHQAVVGFHYWFGQKPEVDADLMHQLESRLKP